jgi:hypothetical protein
MPYTPTAFNPGGPPGINAPFLNAFQAFLQGLGITKVSLFGGYTVTTTPTAFAHNLGVVPDIVLIQITGAAAASRTCVYSHPPSATLVTLTGDASFVVRGIAIKF